MIRARKRFGQHFLEPAWVRKLLDVVQPHPEDVFLEIGPGLGALTLPLAPRVARLLVIEIDRDLATKLARVVPANVRVVTADFLGADLRALLEAASPPVRVVGNLPYNISSPILFRLLALADDGRFFSDATLMLQREVADRVAATPGGRQYGVLSVLTQLRADVSRPLTLPPGAFRPAPAVTSAVVHLAFRPPDQTVEDPVLLEQMVRAAFSQRRKMVGNALRAFGDARGMRASEALAKAGIDSRRRPETLDLRDLAALTRVFASGVRPDVL
jgi:16S rRNA (adenine1518-N6/adenine1519-N6)-dimethyltransferase